MAINFFNQDISFLLKNKKLYKERLKDIIEHYGYALGNINYIFTSEKNILDINKKYLNHNNYTDIITFPYSNEKVISADIFISIPTVKSNSHKFTVSFENELNRILIHGVLHLIGFDDKSESDQFKMRETEDYWLNFFQIN